MMTMAAPDLFFLFLFFTFALAVTLFFIRGAFHIVASVSHGTFWRHPRALSLTRAAENPLLEPGAYPFEASAVMNPGAVYEGDFVHLFYRAIGADGVSRVGYARSSDGIHFDRLPYPVFMMRAGDAERDARLREKYRPDLHARLIASGGSYCGVEDPRAVVIDDRMYMSFSVFSSWDSMRIGVVSLSLDDLLHERWNWTKPVFLSAPHEVQKNWMLFPKKINGKFAVLHGFRPGTRRRAIIEYLDTLDKEPEEFIKSDPSYRDDPKEFDENVWDSRMRGLGTPPIETPDGWLVLYRANDAREWYKYKVGAMLLDLTNPTKVIARSTAPVLEPDMPYENSAKPGIVYASGAIVKEGRLIVYYGGGDYTVCAASAPLDEFLSALINRRKPAFPVRAKSLVPDVA